MAAQLKLALAFVLLASVSVGASAARLHQASTRMQPQVFPAQRPATNTTFYVKPTNAGTSDFTRPTQKTWSWPVYSSATSTKQIGTSLGSCTTLPGSASTAKWLCVHTMIVEGKGKIEVSGSPFEGTARSDRNTIVGGTGPYFGAYGTVERFFANFGTIDDKKRFKEVYRMWT